MATLKANGPELLRISQEEDTPADRSVMWQRTDIHRPSEIIPSDYQYVAVWTMNIQNIGDCEFTKREREVSKAHMERTKGTLRHYSNGSCGICGNVQAIYLVLFYHAKSNEYITVGVNCAQKLHMGCDFKAVELFKRRCADAREQQAGKRKAIALLSDAGLIDAWEIFTATYPAHAEGCKAAGVDIHGDDNGAHFECTCDRDKRIREFDQYEERTIRDIVGKLVKYGNISDNQKGFISKLLGNITRRPIIEAQRAAEREAAAPVTEGRHEVVGTVLTIKEVQTDSSFHYGDDGVRWKALIRLDDGAKVWGSRFANIEKGDRIRFTATFTPSKDDAKFGFYSRPVAWVSPEERIMQVFQAQWPVQEVAQ
jgi:hypothetical protein